MRKVSFAEFGGPDVLQLIEAEEPHAGPGQVRIAVRAAGVNPVDWRLREGQVLYVHNRVKDIEHIAADVRELVPEARVAVAHGRWTKADSNGSCSNSGSTSTTCSPRDCISATSAATAAIDGDATTSPPSLMTTKSRIGGGLDPLTATRPGLRG